MNTRTDSAAAPGAHPAAAPARPEPDADRGFAYEHHVMRIDAALTGVEILVEHVNGDAAAADIRFLCALDEALRHVRELADGLEDFTPVVRCRGTDGGRP